MFPFLAKPSMPRIGKVFAPRCNKIAALFRDTQWNKEVFEMKRTTQDNTYKMNQNVVYCNIKGLLMLQNSILELLELHFQ